VAIIYITQCAENISIHNIIQICTLFDLYIINVQHFLQTHNHLICNFTHKIIRQKIHWNMNDCGEEKMLVWIIPCRTVHILDGDG
jgi:hypothetical protein